MTETCQHLLTLPIGQIELIPNGHHHICVKGEVTIRGKTNGFNAHFHLHADKQWRLGPEGQFNPTHANLYINHPGGTKAFQDKLIEVITPAVNYWALNNPNVLRETEEAHKQECINNRLKKIAEYQEAIKEIGAEITQINGGEILSPYTEVKV